MVPGCTVELSTCSSYNKRLKICRDHQLAHTIEIDGVPQRFCYKCAKLEGVDMFYAQQRSCKASLVARASRSLGCMAPDHQVGSDL